MLSSKKITFLLVTLILTVMFLLQSTSAINESQTVDEGTHLASGYAYWQTANFELNLEHPPLAKYVAALPLLFLNLDNKLDDQSYTDNNQWEYARQLIHNNRVSNNLILNLGRLPSMLLSLLLGLIIFKFAKTFFNQKAAFIALLLYAFDPNIIAHSRYVTSDIYITFFLLLTTFLWVKYLKNPNWSNLTWVSLALAGAVLSKFSSIILIPIIIVLTIIYLLKGHKLSIKKLTGIFFLMLTISYLFIFLGYQCELKKPITDPTVEQFYATLEENLQEANLAQKNNLDKFWYKTVDPSTWHGKAIKWVSYNLPVPAYSYFKGFYILARHNYFGHTAYLLGSHSDFGWWYYFPVAFLVKTPLATILLLIMAISTFLAFYFYKNTKNQSRKIRLFFKNIPFIYYTLFIPPLIYFVWTLTSKLNLGWRHILPIYPFIYIIIAVFLSRYFNRHRAIAIISSGLVLYLIISSLLIYPHYISYFHELVGGPSNGYRYLTDSNLDWGQSLIQLKKYMEENKLDSIYLHYFGSVDPNSYGINWQSPPDNQRIKANPDWQGTIGISVTALFSKQKEFSWLLNYQPIDQVGYSIWIYNIQ